MNPMAEEQINFEDEYDDLYDDVNVGQGFHQLQRSEAPVPSISVANGGFQAQKPSVPESRAENMVPQELRFPRFAQELNLQFPGSGPMAQKIVADPVEMSGKIDNGSIPPLLNPSVGVPKGASQIPSNQKNTNVSQIRPPVDNGATMLFVGELHWWTTDADLESVLARFGTIKEIKFFDERASGKSKGYCQVEFYDSAAAAACKESMNGYIFNGRACVVAFASPETIRQMGASYMNKSSQDQPQSHQQGRRPMNNGPGRGGGPNFPSGDGGRGFGRGGYGRGQGGPNRGGGHVRGRGGNFGPKNNAPGAAFGGPPGYITNPQGMNMMGTGFDPSFMGRGAGYGGFPGPAFNGMVPPFPNVNPMGLAGVSLHVNPAFFGRGMGLMGNTGMDGPHAGMWAETSMNGWGGEEHCQRTRESSYGDEDGGSEYGYGDASYDKGIRSNVSWEKERGSERDWSGKSEKRYRDERERGYREEKDDYREHRQKEQELGYEDDWDQAHQGKASSRSRSRSSAMPDGDRRSQSRDADYGKRRRLPSD